MAGRKTVVGPARPPQRAGTVAAAEQQRAPVDAAAELLELQQQIGNLAVGQLLEAPPAAPPAPPTPPPSVDAVVAEAGQPLDPSTRAVMEGRFGQDFGQVRIHTDAEAAASARTLRARAYTVGPNIVFSAGRYAPATLEGSRLLAHELAHVVQQQRGGATPPLSAGAAHEHDAARAADAAVSGQGAVSVQTATGVGVARAEDEPLTAQEMFDYFVLGRRGHETYIPAHQLDDVRQELARLEALIKADPKDTKSQRAHSALKRRYDLFAMRPELIDPSLRGEPLGTGFSTYAAIQIVDPEGRRTHVAAGAYGNGRHAEEDALNILEKRLKDGKLPGHRIHVVVDQVVCASCQQKLRDFAQKYGIVQVDADLPVRQIRSADPDAPERYASPKTTTRTAVVQGTGALIWRRQNIVPAGQITAISAPVATGTAQAAATAAPPVPVAATTAASAPATSAEKKPAETTPAAAAKPTAEIKPATATATPAAAPKPARTTPQPKKARTTTPPTAPVAPVRAPAGKTIGRRTTPREVVEGPLTKEEALLAEPRPGPPARKTIGRAERSAAAPAEPKPPAAPVRKTIGRRTEPRPVPAEPVEEVPGLAEPKATSGPVPKTIGRRERAAGSVPAAPKPAPAPKTIGRTGERVAAPVSAPVDLATELERTRAAAARGDLQRVDPNVAGAEDERGGGRVRVGGPGGRSAPSGRTTERPPALRTGESAGFTRSEVEPLRAAPSPGAAAGARGEATRSRPPVTSATVSPVTTTTTTTPSATTATRPGPAGALTARGARPLRVSGGSGISTGATLGMGAAAQMIGPALARLNELGIQHRIARELEDRQAAIATYQRDHPGEGVLVVVTLAQSNIVTDPGVPGPLPSFLTMNLAFGGETKEQAITRWANTPKVLQGAPTNFRTFDEFIWIEPSALKPAATFWGTFRSDTGDRALRITDNGSGLPTVTAWDPRTGEPYELAGTRWDVDAESGRIAVAVDLRQRSSGLLIHSEFVVIDADTLHETFEGRSAPLFGVRGERVLIKSLP